MRGLKIYNKTYNIACLLEGGIVFCYGWRVNESITYNYIDDIYTVLLPINFSNNIIKSRCLMYFKYDGDKMDTMVITNGNTSIESTKDT